MTLKAGFQSKSNRKDTLEAIRFSIQYTHDLGITTEDELLGIKRYFKRGGVKIEW